MSDKIIAICIHDVDTSKDYWPHNINRHTLTAGKTYGVWISDWNLEVWTCSSNENPGPALTFPARMFDIIFRKFA